MARTPELRDRYRGTLLGGAMGDALGRPAEGRRPEVVRKRYGSLEDFRKWRRWKGGPIGTVTDDTQMTMCVARSLVAEGHLDPADLARRFVDWLPEGRGKGRTCVGAVQNLMEGKPWHEAGLASAGNGAAMRASPVGLRYPDDLDRRRRAAALSAVVTHADPMAVASAATVACAVALLLRTAAGDLDPARFLENLHAQLGDISDPGHPERRPEAGPERVQLLDRILELRGMLDWEPEHAFRRLYNGAFVLESLPSAIWCFLRSPEEPERVLITAANGGYDADTVAAMAGNLAGAYNGEAAFPPRWRREVEFASELRDLADRLLDLATDEGGSP